MILRNFRIGTRLALGFGSILAIMLVALLVTSWFDEKARNTLADALEAARAKEATAGEMRAVALAQSAAMRNIALHAEIKDMQGDEERARRLGARYDELVAGLSRPQLSPAERTLVEELPTGDKALDQ